MRKEEPIKRECPKCKFIMLKSNLNNRFYSCKKCKTEVILIKQPPMQQKLF